MWEVRTRHRKHRQCPMRATHGAEPRKAMRGKASLRMDRMVSALGNGVKDLNVFAQARPLALHTVQRTARHPRCGNPRLESRMRENRPYGSEGGEAQPSRPLSKRANPEASNHRRGLLDSGSRASRSA